MVKIVEKVGKLVEKLNCFYQKYRKCPNTDRLDKDFHAILQIFYWFGFYQPSPTKTRIAYGVLMFGFIFVTYLMGALNDAATTLQDEDLNQALMNVIIFCVIASLTTLVLSFITNKTKFVDMIRELNWMHEYDHEETVDILRKNCLKMVKIYRFFIIIVGSIKNLLHLIGLKTFRLFMPSIYDLLENGLFYEILLTVNSIHVYLFALLFVACDLMPILSIIRAEYNVNFLCHDLRHCTDSGLVRVSQRNIDACAKYHAAIIEWEIKEIKEKNIYTIIFNSEVNVMQENFGAYLFVKVYGMFVILTFAFFVLLKVNRFANNQMFSIINFFYFSIEKRCSWTSSDRFGDFNHSFGDRATLDTVLFWWTLDDCFRGNHERVVWEHLDGPTAKF
jgi:7tm Odorant receptor